MMQSAMAAKGYRCRGSMATADVAGLVYEIRGTQYLLTDDDRVFTVNPKGRMRPVRGDAMLTAIAVQVEEDHAIAAARDVLAVERAGGDELLAMALRMHLEYNRGHLNEPSVVDGIAFYAVGRNASHDFAVGTKDGKCYVRSCGEGIIHHEDAATMTPEALAEIRRDRLISEEDGILIYVEERVRVVAPKWEGCYLGHH